ncbi:MAG: hypothetical protein MZU97_07700 [Bacillus subtilis]|nr:hypothetical protein [Bacillus subtilis]
MTMSSSPTSPAATAPPACSGHPTDCRVHLRPELRLPAPRRQQCAAPQRRAGPLLRPVLLCDPRPGDGAQSREGPEEPAPGDAGPARAAACRPAPAP